MHLANGGETPAGLGQCERGLICWIDLGPENYKINLEFQLGRGFSYNCLSEKLFHVIRSDRSGDVSVGK